MGNYDWIIPGARVRIKTVEEILALYNGYMPYGLVSEMRVLCNTIQTINYISPKTHRTDCKFRIKIKGFSWPEGAFTPVTTKLGNTL